MSQTASLMRSQTEKLIGGLHWNTWATLDSGIASSQLAALASAEKRVTACYTCLRRERIEAREHHEELLRLALLLPQACRTREGLPRAEGGGVLERTVREPRDLIS